MASVAGSAAAAAYLDAKFHLRKDIKTLYGVKVAEREYARAEKSKRLSSYNVFEQAAQQDPEALAIWSRQGIYTWRDTAARVCQFATYFLELGVRPGDLVALYLQNSPEFLFAWLALWAIGCAPALLNVSISGDSLIHCLKYSDTKILLVDQDDKYNGRVDKERHRIENDLHMNIIILSEHLKQKIAARELSKIDNSYRENVRGDSPAAILYTSGTTGLPKACPFTTARIFPSTCLSAQQVNSRHGPRGDRWYICMPLYHGTGGLLAITQLSIGTSVAIGEKFSARSFWVDVRDSESTVIVYVGETARYLLAATPHSLDKQHKVRSMIGNGMRPDVWRPFQERFGISEVIEFFASSEGGFGTFNQCRGDFFAHAVGHHGAIIRLALRNTFVPVETDSETGSIVRDPKTGFAKRNSYEQGGEILVRTANEAAVFAGYRNAADATAKKFEQNVFRNGDLYYRTGDALRRTSDGCWYFLDRLGDTYRWKSENVSTTEVAEVMGKFPGILEANVYGVEVPGSDGRAGCAAIIIAPEQRENFDWKSLARSAMERLPRYAVPIFIRVINAEVGAMAIFNNKQNKRPLRDEGVDPELRGMKTTDGKKDQVFWLPPQGDIYIKFENKDWDSLNRGAAKL